MRVTSFVIQQSFVSHPFSANPPDGGSGVERKNRGNRRIQQVDARGPVSLSQCPPALATEKGSYSHPLLTDLKAAITGERYSSCK